MFEKGQGRPIPSPSLVTRLNGLNGKRDSLNMLISQYNLYIVCLVEKKLSHNVKANILGYYILKK